MQTRYSYIYTLRLSVLYVNQSLKIRAGVVDVSVIHPLHSLFAAQDSGTIASGAKSQNPVYGSLPAIFAVKAARRGVCYAIILHSVICIRRPVYLDALS